jgi:hypothetical protein
MAEVQITDDVGASASLQLDDDSPLVKAGFSKLILTSASLISELKEPVDKTDISSLSFGLTVTAPSRLIADAVKLTLRSGVNGTLSILKPKDKTVFPDDGFAPAVSLRDNQCWLEIQLDTNLDIKAAATVNGFGLGVADSSTLSASTYSLLQPNNSTFPTLQHSLQIAFDNYRILHNPTAIRQQRPNTIHLVETTGTVNFSGSYAVPINVSALASAELPFQYKVSLNAAITMKVAGEIAVSGSFRVRCYKTSDSVIQLALYKKKGTELTVRFTVGAGIEADIGSTDLISSFFEAVMSTADPKQSRLTEEEGEQICQVLKDSINQSLAISLNTVCSAAVSDETAVAYLIDLDAANPQETDEALAAALGGNWTKLTKLPNARCIRDVVTHTDKHTHKIAINLLGFYNALSVEEYTKSCRILRDEHGQIHVMDQAKASRIATASLPYLADPDRLRHALAEASLASVTYAATTAGGMGQGFGANLKIRQQYFRYDNNMSRQEMRDEVLLGTALGLIQPGAWDGVLAANPKFGHVRVSAYAEYDPQAALSVFLADPVNLTCRSNQELTAIGRRSLASLIDASDPAGQVRLAALANDTVWREMDQCGNMAAFSTIPHLSHLGVTNLAAISADWADIRWWADSMSKLGPKLIDALKAINQAKGPDPSTDVGFMKKRDELSNALQEVTRNVRAAFAEGWGLAVMYALAPGQPHISMDISWTGNTQHYEALGQGAAITASALAVRHG